MPSEYTILQVENNRANVELVRQVIARRSDLKLLTACDGIQGIEMARRFQPALILLDLKLPELGGIDALTRLRQGGETSHIPVIVLSSNMLSDTAQRCRQAGAFAYLTKPYRIDALLASIDSGLKYVNAVP